MTKRKLAPDELHFGDELDPMFVGNDLLDVRDERLDVFCGRAPAVDDKVGVLFRNLSRADLKSL